MTSTEVNKWSKGILSDFITLQRGYDLPEYERYSGNVPVVTSSGISDFHNEAKVKAPGVAMGRYGTIGTIYFIDKDFWPHNTTLYVKDFKGNFERFFYYFLKTLDYQAHNDKSSVPGVNRNHLHLIPVTIPPLPEQRAIAGILGALDDKIEVNRRMNVTLESMARAVFRQWFLDNEDVGNWEEIPLPEIVEVNPSRSLKKNDVAPYLDMANMPTQGHRGIEWIDRPFGSGTKFVNGDTLLARITPCLENGKTAFVDFLEDGQVGWGSTEYIVFRPKSPLPLEYGYFLARSEELRSHAIQNMTGTSGRQRTPASCFDGFMIAKPPAELALKFGEFASSVIAQITANDEESRTLASLRDSLLPKLMRGEVRVKEIEPIV